MTTRKQDPELLAMGHVLKEIDGLDQGGKLRVLEWATRRVTSQAPPSITEGDFVTTVGPGLFEKVG